MAGDVNLFFNDLDDPSVCEVEVMVAEERWRRKGLAREALLMLMRYGESRSQACCFRNHGEETECQTLSPPSVWKGLF